MNIRTLLLGCWSFLLSSLCIAQNQLLSDLRTLTALLDEENPVASIEGLRNMAEVLRHYDPALSEEEEVAAILAAYSENTYLAPFIDFTIAADNRLEGIKVMENGSTSLPASGVEPIGVSLSRTADGLAQFYVQRVKEELNRSFFDRFQRTLEKDSLIGFWFPATKATMEAVGEEIYRFDWYLEDLRNKFYVDLSKLDVRAVQYLTDRGVFSNSLYEALAVDVVTIADLFQNGGSPVEAVTYLSEAAVLQSLGNGSLSTEIHNLKNLFQLLGRLSEMLRTGTTELDYWISRAALQEVLSIRYSDFLLLGLLYQQMQDLEYELESGAFTQFLPLDKMPVLLDYTKEFLTLGESAVEALRSFQEEFSSETDSMSYVSYYSFIHPSLQVIESVEGLLYALYPDNSAQEILSNYVGGISDLNELFLAVSTERYLQGVAYLASIVHRLQVEIPDKTLERIVLYGQFMAAVIDADNSEEVVQVIESFALPPGSASVKKETPFNMAINGYTGLAGGRENLTDVGEPAGFYALSAPLGITISVGLGQAGSLSLYGTILDIGALTAFRFADAETKDLPELSFQNIYTPGLYLVYGVPQLPLSIGFGYQNGPNLRGVLLDPASGDLQFEMAEGYRWNAFIGVDIPLLNLVRTRERK